MARSEEMNRGTSSEDNATELKRELLRFVREIPEKDGEDCVESRLSDVFDPIQKALGSLRDLMIKRTLLQKHDAATVPEHFICPISSELMKDPVILATGQTYDRAHIQAWLNNGNRTCPRTQQILSHLILTPNYFVRNLIEQWCESHGVELPAAKNGVGDPHQQAITQRDRVHLDSLLEKMAFPSMEERKQAAKELRMLTKSASSFRALLGETPMAIPLLLSMLSRLDSDHYPEVQEDVVATILNLSMHDDTKKIVAESPDAIPHLLKALKNGSMETRRNSAAILFSLLALDAYKIMIGESGAIASLVEFLDQGSSVAKKDAVSAIFNLCLLHDNRRRAVEDGIVLVLLKLIVDEPAGVLGESLAMLALLSSNQQAMEDTGKNGGVEALLDVIRDSTSDRNCENAVVVLRSVCRKDKMKLKEVSEEEEENGSLTALSTNGTAKARRKATRLLDRLMRSARNTA